MPLTDPPRVPLAAATRARPPSGRGGGGVTGTRSHPSPASPLSLCPPSDLEARPGGAGTHRHPRAHTDAHIHLPPRTCRGFIWVGVGTFWASPLRWAAGVNGRGPAGLWVVRMAAVLHTHAHFPTPKPTEQVLWRGEISCGHVPCCPPSLTPRTLTMYSFRLG